MYIDNQALFEDNQQHLTTEASANLLDLAEARNLGVGENLYVVAVVKTAMTDAGSDSTMKLTLETDDNAAFSSATERQTIGTFAALSAAGARLVARLAPEVINERYLRVKYTVANGDLTAGKFTVAIVKDLQAFTAYADSLVIS